MLEFFRKYQRIFFIFVAVFIVISFSFFGVNNGNLLPKKKERVEVGRAIDGSIIWSDQIEHLYRMIATDQEDHKLLRKRVSPNWLNDGVIRNDLLANGLAVFLARAYFDDLKETLTKRVKCHSRYKPYRHPYAPFISLEALFKQFAKQEWEGVENFLEQSHDEVTLDTFEQLVGFYNFERVLPEHALRQYLLFQEQNAQGLPKDPSLATRSLGLFGCYSLEDWFGRPFIELVAQWIHNVALLAQERGHELSEGEVRLDLARNAYRALAQQGGKGSEAEATKLYYDQLTRLQLSEKEALSSWRKVMLTRRFFQDYSEAVVNDSLPYEAFYPFASEEAHIDLYRLPEALELKDFAAFLKLNVYLDATTSLSKRAFDLPIVFSSIGKIQAHSPELIEQRAWVEMGKISIDEVGRAVGLKQMWEWQLCEENYAQLEREFPNLAFKKEQSSNAFFNQLEKLHQQERDEVDLFSRRVMVREHPDWIEQALDEEELTEKEVSFSPKGKGGSPIEQTAKGEEWAKLMQTAALKGDLTTDQRARDAREALRCFTPDGETYYRFVIIERDLTKRVLTFAKASQTTLLDKLVDQKLGKAYLTLREKDPKRFQTEEGEWKPFAAVSKEELGELFYAKRLAVIERQWRGLQKKAPLKKDEKISYPRACLANYLNRQLALKRDQDMIEKAPKELLIKDKFKRLKEREPLAAQWNLRKEKSTFKRCDKSPWFDHDLFSWDEARWSQVLGGQEKAPYFFYLREKVAPEGPFEAEMEKGEEFLGQEAKELLMLEVLKVLKTRGGIDLSTREE